MILTVAILSLAVLQQDTLRLSLPEAVTIALREADEVRRANADVKLTEAQVVTSRASALPQLRLTGTYNHVFANARARAVNQVAESLIGSTGASRLKRDLHKVVDGLLAQSAGHDPASGRPDG